MIYSSSYWQARGKRFTFAGGRCEVCGSDGDLEAHHRGPAAYAKDQAGALTMRDLIVVCTECHEAITTYTRARRYAKHEDPAAAELTSVARAEWREGQEDIELEQVKEVPKIILESRLIPDPKVEVLR